MSEGAASEPAREPAATLPFADALMEVVKSLHKDPVLVYGIGAGIILVGVLAFTTSLALVLVVAGVLVAVMLGRVLGRTQAKRGGGAFSRIFLLGGRYENTRGGNIGGDIPAGEVGTGFTGIFTRAKDSEFGNVTYGGASDQKEGKDG